MQIWAKRWDSPWNPPAIVFVRFATADGDSHQFLRGLPAPVRKRNSGVDHALES